MNYGVLNQSHKIKLHSCFFIILFDMKAPYLKNYNRIYDYPNRTEQEKSQRTLDKMSFLLD